MSKTNVQIKKELKQELSKIAEKQHIKKVMLFGSRARGDYRSDSDIDLLVEFSAPVSLLDIIGVQQDLEERIGKEVDVVHYPIPKDSLLEIDCTENLYG